MSVFDGVPGYDVKFGAENGVEFKMVQNRSKSGFWGFWGGTPFWAFFGLFLGGIDF